MSLAEDLLNSLPEDQPAVTSADPATEPHIVINADKTITVPEELKRILVQHEHNIETVTFDCPRYWDGHDLSQMGLRIIFQRSDGHKEPHPVENLRIDESDDRMIHFDWTISGNTTFTSGNVKITVCAKLTNAEGVSEREWHTIPNQDLFVNEGMDCSGEEIVERNPDVIEYILAELDDLKNATPANPSTPSPDSGQNTTQKEVVTTVAVATDPVVLDSTAHEQTVNLVWTVDNARTIPAFTNYYIAKSGMTYPRAFDTAQYVQFFSPSYHGDEAAFVAGHTYFHAMKYRMDGDSTATLQGGSFRTPTGSNTISGSGWVYGIGEPVAVSSSSFIFNKTNTGTGVIEYVYCIDITALNESGTTTPTKLAELAELFGELPLVPGEDYPGGTIGDGTATLSINRGGEISTVDNSSSTATVKGGDVLSVEGGSVTFLLKTYKTVSADESGKWDGIKWVAFGDSLTDGTINADTKYHKLIAERTGITVVDMGKGGTGYWRRNDEGNAFYQRMENVPADADIITIFGTINDWVAKTNGVEYGTATDTIEAGTLAGYINECINVAQTKAPYAQIALVTLAPYGKISTAIQEELANTIMAVAKHRRIKCLDLYHESGFRVEDPVFAAAYTTDYSETAETYGHPSNLAHEKILAPEFMELLRRMILTA